GMMHIYSKSLPFKTRLPWLQEVLTHRGEQYLFNLAHQAIGGQLRNLATKVGYVVDKKSGIMDTNIWGDPEDAVVYRRPSAK
ncbi:MAG: hypothetical protein ABI947_07410, partial [Chloroflexota bacterium]